MATLSRQAKQDLGGLPDALRKRAEETIARLDSEPALGKKLLGKLQGLRSTKLGRTHRIIYRVVDEGPQVVTIVQRKDAYR